MSTAMPKLLVGSIFVFLATACTPLKQTEEAAWTTGWEKGDYYAPHEIDL